MVQYFNWTLLYSLQNDIKDKLTPFIAELNYTYIETEPEPNEPAPILDAYIPTTVKTQVNKYNHKTVDLRILASHEAKSVNT